MQNEDPNLFDDRWRWYYVIFHQNNVKELIPTLFDTQADCCKAAYKLVREMKDVRFVGIGKVLTGTFDKTVKVTDLVPRSIMAELGDAPSAPTKN